ncbi:hypothetical protein [Streptomyces kanamyceticus]|uniref:hypothetical protein n=1 Tax=Streptomyces kanamyceticus TaxID=1967 RepID=UPI0037DCF815
MPEELVAHTGTPDVEDLPEGIMRHPDVMEIQGAFDPRTGSGAVMTDIHATQRRAPIADWTSPRTTCPGTPEP